MPNFLPEIVTNFFSNKIQSTDPEFEEYLIDIANTFAEFDGQPYDYESITRRFRQLSDRPVDRERDPSDFRDEYGAYMVYLGIMRLVSENNGWVWRLSSAASRLLCSDEPNVRGFITVQVSLLQYPILTGVVYNQPLSIKIQGNALEGMTRIINAGIKVVPFRLILQGLFAKSEMLGFDISDVFLSYKEIYFLFNHPLTATKATPSKEDIKAVLNQSTTASLFVNSKFYRNFHIFEQTGLIKKQNNQGLLVNLDSDVQSSNTKRQIKTHRLVTA